MIRLFCAAWMLVASASSPAAEVAGVKIDDTARVAGAMLILNGAGKRTRVIFDVYVAGLYLPEKRGSAHDIIDGTGPKRVSMSMMRDLGAERLVEALEDGIRQNTAPAALQSINPQIAALIAALKSIGSVNKGDVIAIDFLPDGGTELSLNGTARGMRIAGVEFQRALLRVWLGDKPVQADLKAALLGG